MSVFGSSVTTIKKEPNALPEPIVVTPKSSGEEKTKFKDDLKSESGRLTVEIYNESVSGGS